ncbi:MAG: (2Fe-2S)-binding protein [Anaerolineaceae bacterium]|nr:(2Fe-2S)-binding protein [Anaerolineaceae bacterium]
MRIDQSSSLLPEVKRGKKIRIVVDGSFLDAFEGETVAAVLLAAGVIKFRLTREHRHPRGVYCGMGVCYECLVRVDGVDNVRACMTPVVDGMNVETCREVEL